PVHPRTHARLAAANITLDPARWVLTKPLGYFDFLKVTASAHVVLTDSGGVQEETTVLGVPCITLRDTTERPATVTDGTNVLAHTDREAILRAFATAHNLRGHRIPALWDGAASER